MKLGFVPTGFDSWKNYFAFVFAREFVYKTNNAPYEYQKNLLEKIGSGCIYPVFKPLDLAISEIKNPLAILTLTVSAATLVTIIYYPAELISFVSKIFPAARNIQPYMVKFGAYIFIQTAILGIGLRGYGRLGQKDLLQKFQAKTIYPITIGSKVVINK
ncbi:MAG: hypothetical protein L0207_01885 [Chlamydiae bacterium]|nr:hypothetical protein [Chlamydiota bacterium]